MTIEEYCGVIDVELKCIMRRPGDWYATASYVEVMDNGGLRGEYGDGKNPNEALRQYAMQLAGKRIAVKAKTKERREFNVPETLS